MIERFCDSEMTSSISDRCEGNTDNLVREGVNNIQHFSEWARTGDVIK